MPPVVLALDEAYLKALEIEAEKSAHVGASKSRNKKNNAKSVLNNKELMQFELELKDRKPATYRFYEKLNDREKSQVYAVYRDNHKLSTASKTVIDLYLKKNSN